MNRKDIIHKLEHLYKLKKLYGYQKSCTQEEFDTLNKIRGMIRFYEGLINSNYKDTMVNIERLKRSKEQILKRKNRNNKRWK